MRYAKEKILTFLYEWDLNCLLCFPVVLLGLEVCHKIYCAGFQVLF